MKETKRLEVPKFVLENMGLKTAREFRDLKRKQIKAIKVALGKYQLGCAYCPNYPNNWGNIGKSIQSIQSMEKSHSREEWGR